MKALLWPCLAAGTFAACGSPHSAGPDAGPPQCARRCSADLRQVLDCEDNVVETCGAADECDLSQNACTNACAAAEANDRSTGCDYYAVHMDTYNPSYCFAVVVANTWTTPAKIAVEYNGMALAVEDFTRLPVGAGPSLTYAPYDAAAGLAPGEVATLFLSGSSTSNVPCPVPAAVPTASKVGNALTSAFHVTTDVPVSAYQISPYGGGQGGVTAASLLLPASAWDTSYIAVNAAPAALGNPSLNIIAREDGTVATILPAVDVQGGNGVPTGPARQPLAIALRKGQHAQISQMSELTGSIITANKPIGVMAGHSCMELPAGTSYCDHAEQMLPPARALAHRYVGAMYRPRVAAETTSFWRLVGAVDGTQLTWSTDLGGPATLNKGEAVMFETGTPFVVSSQDADHPFLLFSYMTLSSQDGYGDPDFVLVVSPEQYLEQYVFFADPTYPEASLVLVRARGRDQQFHDVMLDCLGAVTGWQPVGADHELARVDLMTGNFAPVGTCSTGRHEIESTAPFGLWVWGWGTPASTPSTAHVSYGYPGGMKVAPINNATIN